MLLGAPETSAGHPAAGTGTDPGQLLEPLHRAAMVVRSVTIAAQAAIWPVVEEVALTAVTPRPHVTAAGGDVERFERIWLAHYAAVHAHAARRVGTRADEVCAEDLPDRLAARSSTELPRDELPWLLAASRNVIGTTWRGDSRRARLQDRLDAEPAGARDAHGVGPDPALEAALAELDRHDLRSRPRVDLGRSRPQLSAARRADRPRRLRRRRDPEDTAWPRRLQPLGGRRACTGERASHSASGCCSRQRAA